MGVRPGLARAATRSGSAGDATPSRDGVGPAADRARTGAPARGGACQKRMDPGTRAGMVGNASACAFVIPIALRQFERLEAMPLDDDAAPSERHTAQQDRPGRCARKRCPLRDVNQRDVTGALTVNSWGRHQGALVSGASIGNITVSPPGDSRSRIGPHRDQSRSTDLTFAWLPAVHLCAPRYGGQPSRGLPTVARALVGSVSEGWWAPRGSNPGHRD
jgi:hypothetical protein